jgi:ankyrin repeat protein
MRTFPLRTILFLVVGCLGCSRFENNSEPTKPKPKSTQGLIESLHGTSADYPDEDLLQLVREYLKVVDAMDDYNCTALHYAARYGRVKTAKWLIEQKANVNTVAYNQFTPMHVVSNVAAARLLIKAGANLKAKDSWGKTPLQKAAEEKKRDVCEAILEAGFPIDLATALRLGKRDLVKRMIKDNPAIAKEADGGKDLWANTTPLGVAAAQGDKEIVELLLKAGTPVNAATYRTNAGDLT